MSASVLAAVLVASVMWTDSSTCAPRTMHSKLAPYLRALSDAADEFRALHERWPEQVDDLVDVRGDGSGPLRVRRAPLDTWGRPYMLQCVDDETIRFGTFGRDGVQGGDGDDADVGCEALVGGRR